VISDATKPRISFSLRLQPFNRSIDQRELRFFVRKCSFVRWRHSRSYDRIKGLWKCHPIQLFYPGAICDRLQIGVLQLVASPLLIACPFRIVALSRLAYRRPTASHRCPSWSPWGCRESCWIAQDYRTKAARRLGYRRFCSRCTASNPVTSGCDRPGALGMQTRRA
jgi:hypothetical protein